MRTALYILWFLVPLFFFTMALWAWLERMGNREKKENPGDLMRQGVFVLICVLISIFIDQFMLDGVMSTFVGDWVPRGFLQVLLLPLVLLIGAITVGGSKEILIVKAPGLSGGRRQPGTRRIGRRR